jgi:hypothetical protein
MFEPEAEPFPTVLSPHYCDAHPPVDIAQEDALAFASTIYHIPPGLTNTLGGAQLIYEFSRLVLHTTDAPFVLFSPAYLGLRRNTSPRSLFTLALTRRVRVDRVTIQCQQQRARIAVVNQTAKEIEFHIPQHSLIEGKGEGQVVCVTKQPVLDRLAPFARKEIVLDWFSLAPEAGRTLNGRLTMFYSDAPGEGFLTQERLWRALLPAAAAKGWASDSDADFLKGIVEAQGGRRASRLSRLSRLVSVSFS